VGLTGPPDGGAAAEISLVMGVSGLALAENTSRVEPAPVLCHMES
jgi:hypothetical protein